MKQSVNKYIFWALIIFALVTRLWGIGEIKSYIDDEEILIPTAESASTNGHVLIFGKDRVTSDWYHPPLKYLLLYGSMKVFGDNPYGWRMRNIIAGTLSVILLFLLARELFSDVRIAYLAALFLSIEPLHIFFSRTVTTEVLAIFFFLPAVYATIRYVKGNDQALYAAGVFLGLSLAVKWYFLLPLLALMPYTIICKAKDEGWRWNRLLLIFAVFIVLPFGIYILTFYAWFGRGYSIPEFFQMQFDAYTELNAFREDAYQAGIVRLLASPPWTWFLKPFVSLKTFQEGIQNRYHFYINNFPVWMMTIPAISFMACQAVRRRDRSLLLALALFTTIYIQFVFVKKTVFMYSSVPVMPFAHLAVAFFAVSLLDRFRASANTYYALAALLFMWGIYLYPLVIGLDVPTVLYNPLLYLADFLKSLI